MAKPVIRIDGLKKNYGEIEAVKGISLEIFEGELFGIIGPNGAGKTTLFRMLLGLAAPSSGRIEVRDRDVSKAWSREVRAHTGYLPENIMFYDHLTGRETLQFYARLKRAPMKEVGELLELTGLDFAADREVYGYSKGMKQRLGLAQSLLGSPAILFLDEPTNGLDPEGIAGFYHILKDVKSRGTTIVLTSHILKEIESRVDRLAIIGDGRLLAAGSIGELRSGLQLEPMISVRFGSEPSSIEERLAGVGARSIERIDGRMLMRCSAADKMKIVRLVGAMDETQDLELVEPSLDDVFFGYAGRSEA